MQFVDDGVVGMPRSSVTLPVEICLVDVDNPQRCFSRIGTRFGRRLAGEVWGEIYSPCVRIQQDFIRIETMAFPGDEGTVNLIGVVAGPVNLLGRDAAMPDATGLVFQIIEAVTVN
ncbi:hypothetical protein [Thiolapillus sp.]|uniref:hypothetical protein n=1 Tax=Thiolapillus sp. TaxID=2017437 RepID=UPI003AF71D91